MRLLLQPTRVLKMHLLSRIQSRFDIFDFNPLILAPNLVTSSRSLFVVPFGNVTDMASWRVMRKSHCTKFTYIIWLTRLRKWAWLCGVLFGHPCCKIPAYVPLDFRAAHFVVVFVWFFFSRVELKKTKQPYIQLHGNHEFHEFILPFSFYDFNEIIFFLWPLRFHTRP